MKMIETKVEPTNIQVKIKLKKRAKVEATDTKIEETKLKQKGKIEANKIETSLVDLKRQLISMVSVNPKLQYFLSLPMKHMDELDFKLVKNYD